MTTSFYAPPGQFNGPRVVLPPSEARHAVRSLRHEPGDVIAVVDGTGGWHRVRLEAAGKQRVVGTVVERRYNVGEPRVPFILAVGVLKKRSRFETVVEKAVELGVTTIMPLNTHRSERARIRRDRLHKIMVAALKQCGRSQLPTLTDPCSLAHALACFPRVHAVCCHEAGPRRMALRDALDAEHSSCRGTLLAVGPEGGFTDAEVATARRSGAAIVHLGPRRLRTETAALTAAGTAMALQCVDGSDGL